MSMTEQLDKMMAKKGIRKSELSRESGVPYTTIQGLYAKGDANVKLSTMIKLADYFACSLDYLADYHPQNITLEEHWSVEEAAELANFKSYLLSKRHQNSKLNLQGGIQWEEPKAVEEVPSIAIPMDGVDKYR